MKISFARPASMALKTILTLALSAVVCFSQNSPGKAGATHKSSSPTPAASKSVSSAQKVVLTVGNFKVTKEEMDFLFNSLSPQVRQAVATHGFSALGQEYALMLLLSQKALDDHLDASPDFRREIDLKKHQMLAQAEYRNLESQLKITPDEVSTYYNAHKENFEEANVREFVVRKKAEGAKPGDPGLATDEAKARLDSIRKAIVAGTDIAQVAKQFDVPNVVMVEPETRTVRRGELLPALEKAAFELKDNQFSEPLDTPQAIVEIQVVGHQQPELKEVSQAIENALRQQKLQVTLDDMKTKVKIWMDPEYFKTPAPQASAPEATPQASAHP
jgi:PPIC-type PPIASE domain